MQDRIEKVIELKAAPERVWQAITDHEEFGQWFRVKLTGPFRVGEMSYGRITYPGYEHLKWEVLVTAMDPGKLFSYSWCPYGGDPEGDDSERPQTQVEFRIEPTAEGTRLTISESGFAALPDDPRRVDALRENMKGWEVQVGHITSHVEA